MTCRIILWNELLPRQEHAHSVLRKLHVLPHIFWKCLQQTQIDTLLQKQRLNSAFA